MNGYSPSKLGQSQAHPIPRRNSAPGPAPQEKVKCRRRCQSDTRLFKKLQHEQAIKNGLTISSLVRVVNAKTTNDQFNDCLRRFVLQRNVWDQVNSTLVDYKSRKESVKGVILTQEGHVHDGRVCSVCTADDTTVPSNESLTEDETSFVEDEKEEEEERASVSDNEEEEDINDTNNHNNTVNCDEGVGKNSVLSWLPPIIEEEQNTQADSDTDDYSFGFSQPPSHQRISLDYNSTDSSSDDDDATNNEALFNHRKTTVIRRVKSMEEKTSTFRFPSPFAIAHQSRNRQSCAFEDPTTSSTISALDISFPPKRPLMMATFRKRTVSF